MKALFAELTEIGFSLENNIISFDGITFGKVSSTESNAIDCYPFVFVVDIDYMWFDASNIISRDNMFYNYYMDFFDKYDYMFVTNSDGTRMKMNSTSNDEVDIKIFLMDILDIYLKIKNDYEKKLIDDFK